MTATSRRERKIIGMFAGAQGQEMHQNVKKSARKRIRKMWHREARRESGDWNNAARNDRMR